MSMLSELLNKEEKLKVKIQKESNRIDAVENKKLSELKSVYETKQRALTKFQNDCKNYLVDKGSVERFTKMMDQYVRERVTYSIEKDVARVSKEFLARIQPKSFTELLALYKLDGVFDALGNCDNAAVAPITDTEVQKAKQVYDKLLNKINKRRNN